MSLDKLIDQLAPEHVIEGGSVGELLRVDVGVVVAGDEDQPRPRAQHTPRQHSRASSRRSG